MIFLTLTQNFNICLKYTFYITLSKLISDKKFHVTGMGMLTKVTFLIFLETLVIINKL